jgi:hypothetical protein
LLVRFDSEDSTDRAYDEIKKMKNDMKESQRKPYVMTEKEKELHRQVAGSLRLIEKSQRKFERDQDQIRSYEKHKKRIIYESDEEDDGYPKCKNTDV